MRLSSKRFLSLWFSLAATMIAGCGTAPSAPTPAAAPPHDQVAAIRAAGDREQSIIDVTPLREPGVTELQEGARQDEQTGNFAGAAAKLDQAIKLSPESPDLLQDRAEMAIRLKDYATAEQLAHKSWALGPKLGPLCARNWQTIVEMRMQANDQAGADTARKWVQQCHKAGVPRY